MTKTEKNLIADIKWMERYRGVGLPTYRLGKRELNALRKLVQGGMVTVQNDPHDIERATLL